MIITIKNPFTNENIDIDLPVTIIGIIRADGVKQINVNGGGAFDDNGNLTIDYATPPQRLFP